jgi:hypothetical protein
MRLDPELLRVEFIGATVRHDPHDLPRGDIAAFFSTVSDRYGFDRLELLAEGGASLSGEGGAELILRGDQTTSCSVTGLGYREGRERVGDALSEALELFGTDEVSIEDLTLVASWDLDGPGAAKQLLADGLLSSGGSQLLDEGEASVGIKVWRRLGGGSLECLIEPMHAEPSKLYLRLVYAEQEPVGDVPAILERADEMREFLHGPLTEFVCERAPS